MVLYLFKKFYHSRLRYLILMFVLSFSLAIAGCFQFGNNYSYTNNKAPIAEIEKWTQVPLPANYSNLEYEIIGDTPDTRVAISLKVPESYYKAVIRNLVKYNEVKANMQSSPGDYGASNNKFMQKPLPNTTVWVSPEGFYRKYVWYQNSKLYIFYYNN